MFWFGYILGLASVISPLAYLYAKGFFNEYLKKPEKPVEPSDAEV